MSNSLPAPTVVTWRDFLLYFKEYTATVPVESFDSRYAGCTSEALAASSLFDKLSATEREMICNDALANYDIEDADYPGEFIDEDKLDEYMDDERVTREQAFINLAKGGVANSLAGLHL